MLGNKKKILNPLEVAEKLSISKFFIDKRLLTLSERRRILEIERNYSRKLIAGIGKPLNIGVQECLKREIVIAVLTSPDFKWPRGPYAEIVVGGVAVGLIDEHGLRVNKEKLLKARREKSTPVIKYLPVRLNKKLRGAKNLIASFPSPPADKYIKSLFNKSLERDVGTLLLGFDIE